jgi:hypothetical protein
VGDEEALAMVMLMADVRVTDEMLNDAWELHNTYCCSCCDPEGQPCIWQQELDYQAEEERLQRIYGVEYGE